MKISVKELAREAGVSPTTVSRVLNNRGRIAPETRRRILELARPGSSGVRLVLLVMPGPGEELGWYSLSLLNHLKLRAAELGLALEMISSRDLAQLPEQNFSGVISFDYNNQVARFWGRNYALPLVCLNDVGNPVEGIRTVFSDEEGGIAQAVNHLAGYNHRRIALLLCGNPDTFANRRRRSGFLAAMGRHGFGEEARVFETMAQVPTGGVTVDPYGVVDRLREEKMSAVIFPSETNSIRILHALRLTGFRVPEDISFISMELPHVSEYQSPPLTTLEQDYAALAALAFETLRRMAAGEQPPFEQKVPYLFRKRGSVWLYRAKATNEGAPEAVRPST